MEYPRKFSVEIVGSIGGERKAKENNKIKYTLACIYKKEKRRND